MAVEQSRREAPSGSPQGPGSATALHDTDRTQSTVARHSLRVAVVHPAGAGPSAVGVLFPCPHAHQPPPTAPVAELSLPVTRRPPRPQPQSRLPGRLRVNCRPRDRLRRFSLRVGGGPGRQAASQAEETRTHDVPVLIPKITTNLKCFLN